MGHTNYSDEIYLKTQQAKFAIFIIIKFIKILYNYNVFKVYNFIFILYYQIFNLNKHNSDNNFLILKLNLE
jgi:hypothetical protein